MFRRARQALAALFDNLARRDVLGGERKLRRAALVLGTAGGVLGMALAVVAMLAGAVDGDAHISAVGFAASALLSAGLGIVWVLLFLRGIRPLLAALALLATAGWHVASMPGLGMAGGLLLLLAGLCALFALEEERTAAAHPRPPVDRRAERSRAWMEIGGINVLVAFLAGMVSCISPCVLPIAPIYVSNLVGGSVRGTALNRQAPLRHAVAFMAGFILLFTALGMSVGLVGFALQDRLGLLERIGGIFLIVMGLQMSGIIQLSAFYRGINADWDSRVRAGYLRSFLSGMFISAGWLPCVGPTLGAILTLAVTSGAALEGGVLLLVYSLGLALPFIGIGLAFSRLPAALRWINRHHVVIETGAGLVMIVMGILLFTGTLTRLNQYFDFASSGLGAKI